MKKKLIMIVCVLLMAVMATGCTTFNNFKNAFFSDSSTETVAADGTIRIGVYEPLSVSTGSRAMRSG